MRTGTIRPALFVEASVKAQNTEYLPVPQGFSSGNDAHSKQRLENVDVRRRESIYPPMTANRDGCASFSTTLSACFRQAHSTLGIGRSATGTDIGT
jgi:hypothetical protein